ncbi:Phytoene synthase [wastewater metagenome]|uniref:Phytoene synthase n=2 Tax=unclassified sequences TaxID=12908 RepID=A0A5B8RB06_9ZZZZ|nr:MULTISPECIES: squalene/phytoene synthase family protein [Arhodomonas]MCS4505026.1 squalene/phytoene synthase family protein [Arhodomonas aquaeolei]QEA05253.1 phytoene synthase [uncultured organism]
MQPQQYCRDKAAPPGSSLHYALLFADDADSREALLAVNAVHAELTAIPREVSDPGVAAAKLAWWREEVGRALDGGAQHPAAQALAAANARRALPRDDLEALLDGVAMDLEYGGYPSFRELSVYCHRLGGGSVRLAVAGCGAAPDTAATLAHDLGMALPLLRGLRRLRPELEAGRLHLPEDELAQAGLERGQLLREPDSEPVRAFLDGQAARIMDFLDNALAAVPDAEQRRLLPLTVHARLYRTLLERLRAEGMPVLQQRHHLTPVRKLWHAWRHARRARAAHRRHSNGDTQ